MITKMRLHGLALLAVCLLAGQPRSAVAQTSSDPAPSIASFSYPQGGDSQITFHAKTGPFVVQARSSLDASSPWVDIPQAKVTELEPGVFLASVPRDRQDAGFYRILAANEPVAEIKGWAVRFQVSSPANKTHFVAGERPVITVTILDTFAQGIGAADLSSLNLYMDGPQDPKLTITPVKLLNATADRTKTPHHYINLKTNPDVKKDGTVMTYTLQPITDELPGTYTVCVRAVLGSDALQQVMKYVDIQIGTPDVEKEVVSRANCAECHQGTVSGKLYMHHIDRSGTSLGSWSLDYEPVRSCKICHNNEGYAAYNNAAVTGGKVPDHIVRRVHGVHMGEGLTSDFNTNKVTGDFRDYTEMAFPADVKNCSKCHTDDRWQTQISRLACGSCHDNTWFGAKADKPATMVLHAGGPATNDKTCGVCHSDPDGIVASVAVAHKVTPPPFNKSVSIALSAPANGKFYVAGEKPTVTLKAAELSTGAVYNPTNMVDPLVSTNVQATEWRTARLFVYGPRVNTKPVLTTQAALSPTTASTAANDLRYLRDATKRDPRVTRTADSIVYQLSDVAGLTPGTYTAYAEFAGQTSIGGHAWVNFQIGSTNVDKLVAGNCVSCHSDTRFHTTSRNLPMVPDTCKACHDYSHQLTGKTNWLNSQFGFGVAPLSRRIHGVHYGNYVNKPKEISSDDFSHIIFPQDVRNCTKCHTESDSWNNAPSRLACLACHDSDAAQTHGTLMTYDPTPADPWSGDEVETCDICHDADGAFNAKKVHAISNPYVPPYPRAPRE